MQGFAAIPPSFALMAPKKARVRQPLLILSPCLALGPPRMKGLPGHFTLFGAPEKARVRQPLLILSPRLALGTPENAGVT